MLEIQRQALVCAWQALYILSYLRRSPTACDVSVNQDKDSRDGIFIALGEHREELEQKAENPCPTDGRSKTLEAKDDICLSNGKFSTEDPALETGSYRDPPYTPQCQFCKGGIVYHGDRSASLST